jgi:DNA-binding NarL/FixJ family response regulator
MELIIEECLKHYSSLEILSETDNEILDIFVDISSALEKIELNEEERTVLRLIMEGYNYSEIERMSGLYRLNVPVYLAGICKRIEAALGDNYTTKLGETYE